MATAMDRSERTGLGLSIVAHATVLALLSVSLLKAPAPTPPKAIPIDISLAEKVGLESAAPVVSHAELAARKSPIEAPVEPDTPPPEPAPAPQPAPPKPEPRPADAAPAHQPAPAPAKAAAKAPSRQPVKPTGNLEGLDLGRSNNKTNSSATNNPASKASAAEVAGFYGVIQRQLQPCANRQVSPGPGAEAIRVALAIRFNRDGSLAGEPVVRGVSGTNPGNQRYVERIKDLGLATVKGCTPIRGLPDSLYDAANGWKSVTINYKLPG